MSQLRQRLLLDASRMPLVIEPTLATNDLTELVQLHRDLLQARLLEHGALLFRGFEVKNARHFAAVVDVLAPRRLDYVYRSTPRTAVGDRIFTASEYPAEQEIPLHNENAYQRNWPLAIAFCCIQPAISGGETPLADTRQVTANIGPGLLEKFASRGVKYIRHYQSGIDLPWQTVFQTEDRAGVDEFCRAHDIWHEWLDEQTLRTSQVCQGTIHHPHTREHIFFNQAHLFHVSSMGPEAAAAMLSVFGRERLPRHACFGDGEELQEQELDIVRAAYDRAKVSFAWQKGDVLWLDNLQAAHGRRPFVGAREVLAALLNGSNAG